MTETLRIALIGQSVFGVAVYKQLQEQGYEIVGVFTIPDKDGKEDPLATEAAKNKTRVFKYPRWQIKGSALPEVMAEYESLKPDLNVLAYVSQFIPMQVINSPSKGSICYHPSILPLHRGASAINWTLMMGDKKAGYTIFWPDDGLDTGAILLQEECDVLEDDTLSLLYDRFLFPNGVKGMVEAVRLIKEGKAPKITQPTDGATYEKLWKKSDAKIDWNQSGITLHNFIRGNDKVPGAWTILGGQEVTLFGSSFLGKSFTPKSDQQPLKDEEIPASFYVTENGVVFQGNDGNFILVRQIMNNSTKKTVPANKYFASSSDGDSIKQKLEEALRNASTEERKVLDEVHKIWKEILGTDEVQHETEFFSLGAGSMHVIVLKEAVSKRCTIIVEPEEIYVNTMFQDFLHLILTKLQEAKNPESLGPSHKTVNVTVNDREVKIPHQLFINGQFVDAASGSTRPTINPTTEREICDVAQAGAEDVNLAVAAAKAAFQQGSEWRRMNARDRGSLMFKLADMLDQHKEELAIIESLDSGAVYTLALKTHVGMSIDTIRYFAGWCDKIEGRSIPINQARPSFNWSVSRREPIGVCGLIVPWNYPLMMLAWKVGPALAAGNTVVIKPASQTPLTALKFAELAMRVGFPKGVINILPGSGAVIGDIISSHPDVRKVGFTGSTPVGKVIMSHAANSNLKRVTLELGGKSPLIILSDCDLERAVRLAMSSAFFNKGENCIAAGRIFVEDTILDVFLEKVVAETKKMVIGDPLDIRTQHGPQNHDAHLQKLLKYIETGVKEGAKLVYGGKRLDRKGYFLEPTIFTDVKDDMYIAKEESFGPIMIILPFSTSKGLQEVISRANNSEFALAAGVFTRDINKALTIADSVEAGTVFVNTYNKTDVAAPFGGFKQSGFGKDLGEEAIHEYLQTKVVTIEYQ